MLEHLAGTERLITTRAMERMCQSPVDLDDQCSRCECGDEEIHRQGLVHAMLLSAPSDYELAPLYMRE